MDSGKRLERLEKEKYELEKENQLLREKLRLLEENNSLKVASLMANVLGLIPEENKAKLGIVPKTDNTDHSDVVSLTTEQLMNVAISADREADSGSSLEVVESDTTPKPSSKSPWRHVAASRTTTYANLRPRFEPQSGRILATNSQPIDADTIKQTILDAKVKMAEMKGKTSEVNEERSPTNVQEQLELTEKSSNTLSDHENLDSSTPIKSSIATPEFSPRSYNTSTSTKKNAKLVGISPNLMEYREMRKLTKNFAADQMPKSNKPHLKRRMNGRSKSREARDRPKSPVRFSTPPDTLKATRKPVGVNYGGHSCTYPASQAPNYLQGPSTALKDMRNLAHHHASGRKGSDSAKRNSGSEASTISKGSGRKSGRRPTTGNSPDRSGRSSSRPDRNSASSNATSIASHKIAAIKRQVEAASSEKAGEKCDIRKKWREKDFKEALSKRYQEKMAKRSELPPSGGLAGDQDKMAKRSELPASGGLSGDEDSGGKWRLAKEKFHGGSSTEDSIEERLQNFEEKVNLEQGIFLEGRFKSCREEKKEKVVGRKYCKLGVRNMQNPELRRQGFTSDKDEDISASIYEDARSNLSPHPSPRVYAEARERVGRFSKYLASKGNTYKHVTISDLEDSEISRAGSPIVHPDEYDGRLRHAQGTNTNNNRLKAAEDKASAEGMQADEGNKTSKDVQDGYEEENEDGRGGGTPRDCIWDFVFSADERSLKREDGASQYEELRNALDNMESEEETEVECGPESSDWDSDSGAEAEKEECAGGGGGKEVGECSEGKTEEEKERREESDKGAPAEVLLPSNERKEEILKIDYRCASRRSHRGELTVSDLLLEIPNISSSDYLRHRQRYKYCESGAVVGEVARQFLAATENPVSQLAHHQIDDLVDAARNMVSEYGTLPLQQPAQGRGLTHRGAHVLHELADRIVNDTEWHHAHQIIEYLSATTRILDKPLLLLI